LALKLKDAQTSLVATHDKLERKSKALDFQVICADEATLRLENTEGGLKAAEEDLKTYGQLLESARQALSKCECSSNMMISLAVAMMRHYSRIICLI
jgi:hypothetical protein